MNQPLDRRTRMLRGKVEELGVDRIRHHILLCCDQGNPKCSSQAEGLESWQFLKARLKELSLVGSGGVYRTKANCLQVCIHGPGLGTYFKKPGLAVSTT